MHHSCFACNLLSPFYHLQCSVLFHGEKEEFFFPKCFRYTQDKVIHFVELVVVRMSFSVRHRQFSPHNLQLSYMVHLCYLPRAAHTFSSNAIPALMSDCCVTGGSAVNQEVLSSTLSSMPSRGPWGSQPLPLNCNMGVLCHMQWWTQQRLCPGVGSIIVAPYAGSLPQYRHAPSMPHSILELFQRRGKQMSQMLLASAPPLPLHQHATLGQVTPPTTNR